MRKIQIGVMGSCSDLEYSKGLEKQAEEIGCEIAKQGAVLMFGAEKDFDSLSTAACRGAKRAGGLTVGVTYGKGKDVLENNADVIIASGMERGGGRELALVLSCDAIIAINGGSGTLTEMAIAYQANIPVITLKNSGGWSEKLSGSYLDNRKRLIVEGCSTPKEAVDLATKKAAANTAQEIVFLVGTHGNEKIGIQAVEELSKKMNKKIDYIVVNERAVEKNVRFIGRDINRIAPGKIDSSDYEEKRVAEVIQMCKPYKYVIDIHGTDANTGIFCIVTNPTKENLLLAAALPCKNIVIWESTTKSDCGPITKFVNCGIEIECGPQSAPGIKKELLDKMEQIIMSGVELSAANIKNKKWFKVYKRWDRKSEDEVESIPLNDFELVNYNGEEFYPLLVNRYKNRVCNMMKKIDPNELM